MIIKETLRKYKKILLMSLAVVAITILMISFRKEEKEITTSEYSIGEKQTPEYTAEQKMELQDRGDSEFSENLKRIYEEYLYKSKMNLYGL